MHLKAGLKTEHVQNVLWFAKYMDEYLTKVAIIW